YHGAEPRVRRPQPDCGARRRARRKPVRPADPRPPRRSRNEVHAVKRTDQVIAQTERVSAHNYAPLPVVITRAEGVFAWDIEGRKYLDCISAYSSLNQGHRHPRILKALTTQAGRLTLTSRAVHNDRLGPFLEKLCNAAEMDMALPMNTGAEAVETAIKVARKWG